VTSYLSEKLSKLRSFDRQQRRPQNCHFPVVFQRTAQFTQGTPTVSSVYLSTPRWHHLKAHPFLANHTADEHRMIYSISKTTSYSTIYAFFSSFRITLWPMWLANSKRQPCFIHHSYTHKKTHRTEQKKLQNLKGNLCYAKEHSVQFFVQFITRLNYTV
jgi:hypothetical protein